MKKLASICISLMIVFMMSVTPIVDYLFPTMVITAEAHSGRTDSSGGHKDNNNKSGLGSYHYHCGGNPPHLHSNGCPYSSKKSSSSNSSSSSTKSKSTSTTPKATSSELVKKVQTELNALGYDCGTPDGIQGKKTTAALKNFQEDNDLTVDGIIGAQVKEALSIDE